MQGNPPSRKGGWLTSHAGWLPTTYGLECIQATRRRSPGLTCPTPSVNLTLVSTAARSTSSISLPFQFWKIYQAKDSTGSFDDATPHLIPSTSIQTVTWLSTVLFLFSPGTGRVRYSSLTSTLVSSASTPRSTTITMAEDNTEGLNYVVLVPFNGTEGQGGDSLSTNLNMWYQSGDIGWMITATALVLLMIPGVGFFYSGLARRKSALSLIWLSIMATAVTTFQWFFWGYSLTFSRTAGPYIGNLAHFGFIDVLAHPSVGSDRIPDLLFAIYQGMFSAITVALATGAVAERGRMLPCVIFMFIWATVIYDPIACWTWNPSGWSNKMGGLDFAGGTPVHIASGAAALAYSMMLGKRRGHGTHELNYRPHNVTHIVIGTVFLWVGWFGFNAGSALAANMRAIMAAVVTNLAACSGGITWCVLDYRLERKWSTVGFCSGVVAGLVAITPGSGYVPVWSSVIYGILGAAFANYATKLKFLLRIDDALDIFAVHGIGGLVGNILTAFFASDWVAHLDNVQVIKGGWVNHNWMQLPIQLADSFSGGVYSFVGTSLILFLMNLIPGLHLRASEESEILGIDDAEIGEFAYDYVELTREVLNDVDGETGSMFSTEQHPHHSQAMRTDYTVTNGREKNGFIMMDPRTYSSPAGQSSV